MYPPVDVTPLSRETRGDPRVVIAILDGPVDFKHESLKTANLDDLSLDSCHCSGTGESAAFHGTLVCSIIFGQGPAGIVGIAPRCRGIVIPIFQDGPVPGSILPCSQVELAIAIERAIVAGANIINISGGQYSPSGTAHPLLSRVIERAAEAGVLIVSATGNDARSCYHIPSAHPDVLAVGAHDQNGNALESSNWGETYRQNGVVALGDQVLGAVPGGTRRASGTSFATPIVSGVAALLLSCQLKMGQQPDVSKIRNAIIQSAHRCYETNEACHRKLAGILNPKGAFNYLFKEQRFMNYAFDHHHSDIVPASEEQLTNTEEISSNSTPREEKTDAAGSFLPSYSSAAVTASEMKPSKCNCGCAASAPLVFVIGEIGYDFGTEARRDSIKGHMIAGGFGENPDVELSFVNYLRGENSSKESPVPSPWEASSVIWTLTLNNVPIYAIKPGGAYASEAYAKLVEFMKEKVSPPNRNYVAIPGRIVGNVRLLKNGQTIPVIAPEIRGMSNWGTLELVNAVVPVNDENKLTDDEYDQRSGLHKILDKIYFEHQNLGIRPQDRAINYAASNTAMLNRMIKDANNNKMFFDDIELRPSEICRPGSECWVVKVNFYVPTETNRSRRAYRFTIDVSDTVPVAIDDMRDWYVR